MMQGYYFGQPVPADKFEEMLRMRDIAHAKAKTDK
jgi:EAL domain-containing protein (putative c-di-GMP-specific phosphodiesterase class I)